jgi:dCMP deaminase
MNYVQLLTVARQTALGSRDPRTQVGAVAVERHGKILETGTNSLPRGVDERPERLVPPAKYDFTLHAEARLVADAARPRLKGTTVAVTHLCCGQCAALLIEAGVSCVVVGDGTWTGKDTTPSRTMFHEAGVTLIEVREGVPILYEPRDELTELFEAEGSEQAAGLPSGEAAVEHDGVQLGSGRR